VSTARARRGLPRRHATRLVLALDETSVEPRCNLHAPAAAGAGLDGSFEQRPDADRDKCSGRARRTRCAPQGRAREPSQRIVRGGRSGSSGSPPHPRQGKPYARRVHVHDSHCGRTTRSTPSARMTVPLTSLSQRPARSWSLRRRSRSRACARRYRSSARSSPMLAVAPRRPLVCSRHFLGRVHRDKRKRASPGPAQDYRRFSQNRERRVPVATIRIVPSGSRETAQRAFDSFA
jgi:hypothetical protein